jgi:CheY-like chemotaxis protein
MRAKGREGRPPAELAVPTETGGPICRICGQPIANGELRYRGPDGNAHVRCHEGPRVLVVEDDAGVRELVADLIRRERSCQVHKVSNGQEALQRVRVHVYDLILCDLRMPEMDGPTFYQQMRAEHPELASRIVFMTAHAKLDEYAVFMRDVRAPVLTKPFCREDFDATLARMIGPIRSRRGGEAS